MFLGDVHFFQLCGDDRTTHCTININIQNRCWPFSSPEARQKLHGTMVFANTRPSQNRISRHNKHEEWLSAGVLVASERRRSRYLLTVVFAERRYLLCSGRFPLRLKLCFLSGVYPIWIHAGIQIQLNTAKCICTRHGEKYIIQDLYQ